MTTDNIYKSFKFTVRDTDSNFTKISWGTEHSKTVLKVPTDRVKELKEELERYLK